MSRAEQSLEAQVERLVADELARGMIPGVALALVDDQRLVLARGFGWADVAARRAVDERTLFRAGSISKLFTALAVMQLVERGQLSLDAPLQDAWPAFHLPGLEQQERPVTLRQLLCHRSGLIREAPVGGYFDASQPSLAATIASVRQCPLVTPPQAKTRYSNVGPTLAGRVVELASGLEFADYQRRHLLGPLGMTGSAWAMNDSLRPRLATGYLQVARPGGGFRERPAPHFELATVPAGNLYTTAPDLARLLHALLAAGHTGADRLLRADSLLEMFTPQLTSDAIGFGLGFAMNRLFGRKTFGHMGAVYGFTSLLLGMPKEKLGVVVLANADLAVGPVRRLAWDALALMLAARGAAPPQPPAREADADELSALAGRYQSPSYWAELRADAGQLRGVVSGQPVELTPTAPGEWAASGRIMYREPLVVQRDPAGRVRGFVALRQTFARVEPGKSPPAPPEWQKLLGSFGPDYIPLIVSIRDGQLYAMTENEYDYRLTPISRTVFRFPAGLYEDEHLVFQLAADGRAGAVVLANMYLERNEQPVAPNET